VLAVLRSSSPSGDIGWVHVAMLGTTTTTEHSHTSRAKTIITRKDMHCYHSRGIHRHLGTTVRVWCAGCNRSQGLEVSAMALGGPVMAMAALVQEESAPVLAHPHCTMAQRHWHRRFQCRSRNLQQTGGTNRCCRRRNPHSLPRTCNNLQRRVVPAPVRAARDHHWR